MDIYNDFNFLSQIIIFQKGINTLNPQKIIVTSIIFLQLIFLVMYGHHILDYFELIWYIINEFFLLFFKFFKYILYDIVKKLQNESQNDNFSNIGRLLFKGI